MFVQTALRVTNYQPRTSMPPHHHDEATFGIIVGGSFRERIARGERAYARGHVTFCPAGMRHSQTFGEAGARQIIFAPRDCWLDYLADCRTKLEEAPHAYSLLFRQLGDRLLAEIRNGDGFSAVACEGILLEIIAAFGRSGEATRSGEKPPAWLQVARDFIHENTLASLDMSQLARAAGRHEIHLARVFRRFFGTSIGAYLRRIRTEHAAELLLKPHANVSDIAFACGFASHSHLCREFKAHYGVTPSAYRSRMA